MNIPILYTDYKFKIRENAGVQQVFDTFRKKYIVLNPEEWVRQNLLQSLVHSYQYPSGVIAVEKELKINQLKRRYDAVIYDLDRKPWMLIECKAPHVTLNESTLNQILHYYSALQCRYLMISNGHNTFVADISSSSFQWLDAVPAYDF